MSRNNVWVYPVSLRSVSSIVAVALTLPTIQPAYSIDYQSREYQRCEEAWFGPKGWNLKKEIEKLLKPINELNKNSTLEGLVLTMKSQLRRSLQKRKIRWTYLPKPQLAV